MTQKTVVVLPGPTGPTGTFQGINILGGFTGFTGQFPQWLQATGASGPNGLLERLYNIGPTGVSGAHKTVIISGYSGGGGAVPNWFFSAAGSDANDGRTISTPKQTIAAFNALTFQPGDYVAFRGGDTFTGTLVPPSSGSALALVTYGSYGVGKATISPGANANGIVTTNLSYFSIRDFIVTGSGTTSAVDGIQCNQTSGVGNNLFIDNCTVSGFAHDGIMLLVTGGSMVNPTVTNCTTNGNATGVFNNGAGLQLRGIYGAQNTGVYSFINPLIFNCTAKNNLGAAGTTNWTGSGIHTAQCSGGTILSCLADNNGQNCNAVSGPCGIWVSDSNGHIIQSCESSNNKTANADGAGFDMDGGSTACILQYNYSHGNYGTGLTCFSYTDPSFITGNFNNIIRFNISINDASGAATSEGSIYVVGAASANNTGLQIYNNVVYTSGPSATSSCLVIANNGGTVGGTIANNIFISRSASKLAIASGGNTFAVTGNCWWPTAGQAFSLTWAGTTYTSFAAWIAATGLEKISGVTVGLNVDPKLVNAGYSGALASSSASQKNSYKPAPGSPCLGVGVNLLSQYGITVPRDYFGNAVPRAGGYDIGCGSGAAVLGATVTAALTDHAEDTTSQTTYTYAGKTFAIGGADPSRLLVAIPTGRIGANTTATVTSLTIGGIVFTLIPGSDSRNTFSGALTTQSMWVAAVPTGTTLGPASVVYSNAMLRTGLLLFSVVGSNGDIPSNINAASFADATGTGTGVDLMTVPAGGVGIIGSSLAAVTGTPVLTPTNYALDLAATAIGTLTYGGGHSSTPASPSLYTSTWTATAVQSATATAAAFMPTVT